MEFSGKTAMLESDGRTFADVAPERLETAHPAPEVALGDLLCLVDRAGDCDRLVVAFLVFGDQHRQTQFGVGLQRDRKSVVTLALLFLPSQWWPRHPRDFKESVFTGASNTGSAGSSCGADGGTGWAAAIPAEASA
jgi:hypothetical protein